MNILDEIYDEIYLGEEPDTEEYRELRESYYAVWVLPPGPGPR